MSLVKLQVFNLAAALFCALFGSYLFVTAIAGKLHWSLLPLFVAVVASGIGVEISYRKIATYKEEQKQGSTPA